jgi:hypothetical protein
MAVQQVSSGRPAAITAEERHSGTAGKDGRKQKASGVQNLAREGARATRPDPRPRTVQTPVQESHEGVARTEEEHVQAIADRMADGRWLGRRSIREYAERSGLRRGTVKDYARAAALACFVDEDEIEQRRQPALGRWLKLHRKALRAGDLKAAATALAGYDRAGGVVQPGGTKVQVNILSAPDAAPVVRALTQLVYALCPAEAGILDDFLGAVDQDRDRSRTDPLGWLERRRGAITVEPG